MDSTLLHNVKCPLKFSSWYTEFKDFDTQLPIRKFTVCILNIVIILCVFIWQWIFHVTWLITYILIHLFISKSNCWHTVFFLPFLCLKVSTEKIKPKPQTPPHKNQTNKQTKNPTTTTQGKAPKSMPTAVTVFKHSIKKMRTVKWEKLFQLI